MFRKDKIIVFMASEIQTPSKTMDGAVPVFTHRSFDGKTHQEFYSTGRLETAIKKGYRVIVLESGPLSYEGNNWWKRLVQKYGKRHTVLVLEDYQDIYSPKALDCMRELYSILSVPWDHKVFIWLRALYALTDHGVLRGCQIDPETPEVEEEITEFEEIIDNRPSLM